MVVLRRVTRQSVVVQVPNPEFEGQTKNRLGNPEVRGIVDAVVSEQLLKVMCS